MVVFVDSFLGSYRPLDRKKMTEVTVLPADVEVLESIKVPNYRWNLSYFMRKLRSIKVREIHRHAYWCCAVLKSQTNSNLLLE